MPIPTQGQIDALLLAIHDQCLAGKLDRALLQERLESFISETTLAPVSLPAPLPQTIIIAGRPWDIDLLKTPVAAIEEFWEMTTHNDGRRTPDDLAQFFLYNQCRLRKVRLIDLITLPSPLFLAKKAGRGANPAQGLRGIGKKARSEAQRLVTRFGLHFNVVLSEEEQRLFQT